MDREELEGIEKKALEQLKSGKSFFGKDGAFAPLLKGFIEKALESEIISDKELYSRRGDSRTDKTACRVW